MPTPDQSQKKTPPQKSDSGEGKPTIEEDTHDKNVGQRERTKSGDKPTNDDDNRGKNYGQREGSTTTEDNDVE